LLEASHNKKDLLQELLLERGVVPEVDAPSHQFALIAKENDVDDSLIGVRNTTKEKREKLDWVISELGYDQVDTVISSWKFRHKAGDEATVRGMLQEMVAKKRSN